MTSRHAIPDAALDDRLAFVGTSGSRQDLRRRHGRRAPAKRARVVVGDPLDVWWALRGENLRWIVVPGACAALTLQL